MPMPFTRKFKWRLSGDEMKESFKRLKSEEAYKTPEHVVQTKIANGTTT